MKRAEYLKRIEQTDPFDIESFVEMSREVVANKANLLFNSRDELTELLAEKMVKAVQLRRAQLSHFHSSRPMPARMHL